MATPIWWLTRIWVVISALGAPRATVAHNAGPSALEQNTDERKALLDEGLILHRKGELEGAARAYSRLLEDAPKDRDGLALLGLTLYGRGKLARATLEADGATKNTSVDVTPTADNVSEAPDLFKEAKRLVASAVEVANGKEDALQLRGILGEVLRAKGDLYDAVSVLREALAEQGWGRDGTKYRWQSTLFLASTLIEIIHRDFDVSTRLELADVPEEMSEDPLAEEADAEADTARGTTGWTGAGVDEWALRLEAEGLLKEALAVNADDKSSTRRLAMLLKSNWDRYDVEGGVVASEDSDHSSWNGRRQSWGSKTLFWFERALHLDPSDAAMALERAVALHRLGRTEEAEQGYKQVLAMEGSTRQDETRDFARSNLAALLHERGDFQGALKGYRALLEDAPRNAIILNNLGTVMLLLDDEEGVAMLDEALALEPSRVDVMMNVGLQCQDSGDLERARALYLSFTPKIPVRARYVPSCFFDKATEELRVRTLTHRAGKLKRNDGLAFRRAIMLPPVMVSEEEIAREKLQLVQAVDDLIGRDPPLVIPDPVHGLQRVHFYLAYRGGNHREIQQKIARMHTLASPGILSVSHTLEETERLGAKQEGVSTVTTRSTTGVRGAGKAPRLRVGFVSKFFGDEEPHGMLLEGIMRHLPRGHFHVTVCPIAHPTKRLSPTIAEAADEVASLPSKLQEARAILEGLMLDVLVYADMNSEPLSHFLGFSRLARVQAVFWGNPITTGNPSIDYFVSADVLEPQNRTMLPDMDEPYSEQVMLLGGQGIWYEQPIRVPSLLLSDARSKNPSDNRTDNRTIVREVTKAELRRNLKSKLGFSEDSMVYMCPQSVFKLRPAFDFVLRDIIQAFADQEEEDDPGQESSSNTSLSSAPRKAHVVLIEGRRKRWNKDLWQRLEGSIPEIISQVRVVPRTSAGVEFHSLLASADVLLHPFPFGGSKTAADGLSLGVPVVAMEGDALPGRMAYSLYKTMGLDHGLMDKGCCIARDRESYVQLAVRLGRDAHYRRWAGDLIDQRSSALWDRREVVLEWARFLARAGGRPIPSITGIEVGLEPGTDVPLAPPEPFQRSPGKGVEASTGSRARDRGNGENVKGSDDEDKEISLLLKQFSLLHHQGKLHDAVEVLETALSFMERRNSQGQVGNRVESYNEKDENDPEGVEKVRISALLDDWPSPRSEEDDRAIARVMNDLGCTLQQLWRLDEAELMLRRAIARTPHYVSAMTSLGVTLQANHKLDEAEFWYREALRLAAPEERDACLCNLALLMRAGGKDRLEEAINLIVGEAGLAPFRQEGLVAAILSLLQPRPSHKQVFLKLEKREGFTFEQHNQNRPPAGLWEEVNRLREGYPASTNNLVVFLGYKGNLPGVYQLLQDIAGMEPMLSIADERRLLPVELHSPWHYSDAGVQTGRGDGNRREGSRQARHRDRHKIHLVTQYYLPRDAKRAREVDVCLVRNLQNPVIGTVHLLADHPDALPSGKGESSSTVNDARPPWKKTEWIPPVLRGLNVGLTEKVTVVSLGKRMTFRDAFRYANDILNGQVVILANSDIFFDESLLRLGDPATLNMKKKVFALGAWESKVVPLRAAADDVFTADIQGTTTDSEFLPRTDSQDAWIFRAPLLSGHYPETITDFAMGRPRCDGRLAQVLIDAGYSVTNPSLSLGAHHLHSHSPSGNSGEAVQRGFPMPDANDTTGGDSGSYYSEGFDSVTRRTYRGDTQVAGKTASVLISDQWLF